MANIPTTEDRIWAVLSHLSALAFGMGIALPVVGWSDQRRKSNYAAFQSLQALGYQSLGFTVWALSYLVIILLVSAILLLAPGIRNGAASAQDTMLIPAVLILVVVTIVPFVLYYVLPIVAAVACLLGRDFRYPILGDRLARYLNYPPSIPSQETTWPDEDREIRWVAAMGHFSILILLWGMLAPLLAWILQGRQNRFLQFQSIQTLIYQALAAILAFVASLPYLIGLTLLAASFQASGASNFHSSPGIAELIILGALLLCGSFLLLLVPLLHILGQWAGYRVLKGDDYRYPLIGQLVEKQLSKHFTTQEDLR